MYVFAVPNVFLYKIIQKCDFTSGIIIAMSNEALARRMPYLRNRRIKLLKGTNES